MEKESVLTPWEVKGNVDYDKIVKEFGTNLINKEILSKLGKVHSLIRRGFYFSHRDFDLWLQAQKKGERVSVITGRGPSEKMHVGHLVPFLIAKNFQDIFNCEVFIAISDDEKFYVKEKLSFDDSLRFSKENIIDILALGFNLKKTFVMQDFVYTDMYKYGAQIAKKINYSTARAIFGLKNESNIGWSFYPAMQAAHILFPQFKWGAHLSLVPIGIDQDPFIRLTRDIAENKSFNFRKPCAIHSKFIPSLYGDSKMSASEEGVIFLDDSSKEVERKIKKYAFSGGKNSLEEHRKFGGSPEVDVSFQYLKAFFEEDDKKLSKIESDYKSGKMLTLELKEITIKKINEFLEKHRKNKEKIKKEIDKCILRNE